MVEAPVRQHGSHHCRVTNSPQLRPAQKWQQLVPTASATPGCSSSLPPAARVLTALHPRELNSILPAESVPMRQAEELFPVDKLPAPPLKSPRMAPHSKRSR